MKKQFESLLQQSKKHIRLLDQQLAEVKTTKGEDHNHIPPESPLNKMVRLLQEDREEQQAKTRTAAKA